jgi:Protein of unknown function (DUF2975)
MTTIESLPSASGDAQQALQRRIGWLCHIIRLIAAAYALWILVLVLTFWGDPDRVMRTYSHILQANIIALTNGQRLAGFAVSMGTLTLAIIACWSVWQMFSGYLAGRIFTVDSAIWLRRIGTFGLMAHGLDILTRPLVFAIVTWHMPAGQRATGITLGPNDLLIALFLLGLVALAHVFKAAAEIADDNAQIV